MDRNTVVNIGVQHFDRIREQGAFYIDKTGFIKEWWEQGSDVTLITRPRRFGKTLNMSMLECFFSNRYADRADLFEELAIFSGSDGEKYRQLQGTYPVIFLTFAPIKSCGIGELKVGIKQIIANAYQEYRFIMESDEFDDNDRKYFASISLNMDDAIAYMALNQLCIYLKRYYGRDVIVLLDEYDTPMQVAWLNGYWDEAVAFTRAIFNSTFKANKCLYRGLITGVTRISKESIFSDLNNLDVITTTHDQYATAFGLTEDEVFAALDDMGVGSEKQGVKQWYDGFTFGRYTGIYNPWSIASFIKNCGRYEAYWANTSGNGIVNSLIRRGRPAIKKTMEELIQGGSFTAEIDEQIVFNQLGEDADGNAIWSLLLAAGYLKILSVEGSNDDDGEDNMFYTLAITNSEVRSMFRKMIKGWFESGNTNECYNEFIKALLNDNVRKMNTFMNKVALNTFSSFDSGNKPSEQAEPERFYHGFVLGMVVNLSDRYKIRSNRESGYGRYDVMIEPLDKAEKAFIFEFKVLDADDDEETLEDTLANAHAQIEEKRYEAELITEGFAPERIRKYGFAFKGKECLIG